MLRQLVCASGSFHAVNSVVVFLLLRVWRHRHDRGRALSPARLIVDICVAGSLGLVSAVVVGGAFDLGAFGIVNLLSQWILLECSFLLAMSALALRRSGKPRWSFAFVTSAAAILATFIDARFVEPRALAINEHLVNLPARGNEAHAGGELRIVHLSDIQTNTIGSHERRAFREAANLRPDLIVLTGDHLQAGPGYEDLRQARDDFKRLLSDFPMPPLGIYAVKGDVEGPDWPSIFNGTRVVPLTDSIARFRLPNSSRSISLLGLSPGLARGRDGSAVRRLVRELPEGDLKIVFGHSPDFVIALNEGDGGVDLALGGHTHGGQITVPFWGAPMTLSRLPHRMARGLHSWQGTALHVSAGVGLERGYAPPLRFLCQPEVCLLRVPLGSASANGASL